MPIDLLDYYFTLLEVLVILLLLGAVGIAVFWGMERRWRNRRNALEQKHTDDLKTLERKHADELKTLKQKYADDLAKHDSEYFQPLRNHLHSAVAHDFGNGLNYIRKESVQTLEGLREEQNALREKQKGIIAKAYEMDQHAENILNLFDPEGNGLEMEFLNMRRLIEGVVSKELLPYADSEGVTLMANLDDVEPTLLDKDQTLVALKNVIHNAIKYSFPGGVVKIVLSLEIGEKDGAEKMICVEVIDTGKGIPDEDRAAIFDLRKRGDGLIKPGSGLGLYLARKAARRQGGDVVLATSTLNQGSVFKITLPYIDFEA